MGVTFNGEAKAVLELLAQLFLQPRVAMLCILLLAAAWFDIRTLRIPNCLTFGGAGAGLVYAAFIPFPEGQGLFFALAGMAAGLLVMLPLYALRIMGAADVKLMAAVGTFLGFGEIFPAVLASLISGGASAIVFAFYRRAPLRLLTNSLQIVQSMALLALARQGPGPAGAPKDSVGRLPFGASICAGTITYLAGRQLGFF